MSNEKMIALLTEIKAKADEFADEGKCLVVMQNICSMMPSYGHSWVFYATPVICGSKTSYTATKEQMLKFVNVKLNFLNPTLSASVVDSDAPAQAKTLAEKVVALSENNGHALFVPASEAVAAGLAFDESIVQEGGDVSPYSIAMRLLLNESNFDCIPNLVDHRGSHYKLRDGSWILFREWHGRYPAVGDGALEDDPIGGHD